MNVPPVAIAPGAGRVRGMPNFRAAEDLWLAKAYTMTTVNAAIGTDQNATTFWSKIRDAFIVQGGSEGRTACSLQNRFNKAVQPEVNKFIGFLQGTLREYHSGWVLDDYINDAKRLFQVRQGKPFKHELVWHALKERLPKFQIVQEDVAANVRRALFFLDDEDASILF